MNGSEMKGMIKDTLIMFAITLIAGLLLGFTYELTKEPIAKQEQEASDRACAEVFYEADANGELQKVVDLTFEEAAADEALSAKLKEDGYKGAVIDKVFTNEKYFRLISSNANSFFEDELMEFAKKEKIDLKIEYYDDLEITNKLQVFDDLK